MTNLRPTHEILNTNDKILSLNNDISGKQNEIICMDNVGKVYRMNNGEYRALSSVNISINKGEFVAIVGPSGAGKSTLMNIIGCLDTASEGKYVLDGINTQCDDNKLAEIRNRKIGFIFQTYNLLPKLDIVENVEMPLEYMGTPYRESRRKALECLEKVGLTSHLKHRPQELSGGQMQRVAIARALVTNPQIILADEPTGALDSKTGSEVLQMLRDLNREGHTIILITHDKDIAKSANRIITLKDGYVISDLPNIFENEVQ